MKSRIKKDLPRPLLRGGGIICIAHHSPLLSGGDGGGTYAKVILYGSTELGYSQNEVPNNEWPSLRLGVTTTPPPPPPAPPFDGGEQFILRRGTYPPPVPLPTSGEGSTAPYPVARTPRYPRPIRGSRGRFLTQQSCDFLSGFARHTINGLINSPLHYLLYDSNE